MNHKPENTTSTHSTSNRKIVAIDIAKDSLDVFAFGETFSVPNNPAGFKALLHKIRPDADTLVVFEATGGYERPLADYLHSHGVALWMLNPRLLRAFAKSDGIKAKTDRIDVRMIHRFASQKVARPTLPPNPQRRRLCDLLDRRCQLTEALAREKNRIQKALDKEVLASLRRNIKSLEKEILRMETKIRSLVESTPCLKEPFSIMVSVVGVGEVTAWTLLARLPEIALLSRGQVAAMAGVAPYNKDSGKHSGKRYTQGGRAKVRRALFMAAKTAAIFNPVIRPYVQGLIARGKPYKCALTAAMRKLLIHIQSLLKKSEKNLEFSPC